MTEPINLDEALVSLKERLAPYLGNESYVFKSCQEVWIAVLQKLEDTITNEDREDIVDIRFAKCRANKMKVIDIVHKHKDESCRNN